MKEDRSWSSLGITGEFLEKQAAWLREQRMLHDNCARFFQSAGELVFFSRFHYPLASLALFQAVIGLERGLKLHYGCEDETLPALFSRAVEERRVHDGLFSDRIRFSSDMLRLIQPEASTYSEKLFSLVPKLRNQFFHGTYLLSPEYLHLTFQLREIADALDTGGTTATHPKTA